MEYINPDYAAVVEQLREAQEQQTGPVRGFLVETPGDDEQ